MTTLKKLWPSVLPIIVLALNELAPTVQKSLSSHEKVAAAIATLFAVLAHWLPSPLQKS